MNKILILCTRNSCRSQMAEGFLRQFDEHLHIRSTGTNPSDKVMAIFRRVRDEIKSDFYRYTRKVKHESDF